MTAHLSPLQVLEARVEETHPGLGRLVALLHVVAVSRTCMLVVGVAGSGKSTASRSLLSFERCLYWDSVTRAGLMSWMDTLTGFEGVIVIDDMGKIDSEYSRISTATTLAELCYSHFVAKFTFRVRLQIAGFGGSAVMNIQPIILSRLVRSIEWDAVLADKVLRYYHLRFPTRPVASPPVGLAPPPDATIDDVQLDLPAQALRGLYRQGQVQWSLPRTIEHVSRLLRGVALWAGRDYVNEDDVSYLEHLLKPMIVEGAVLQRHGLETRRVLDHELLCLLTELASANEVKVHDIARHFRTSVNVVHDVLDRYRAWWAKAGEGSIKRSAVAERLLQLSGYA